MRQAIREIEGNNAYQWFIGYDPFEPIPHDSAFGKNFSRRFAGTDVSGRVVLPIPEEAVKCGFADASVVCLEGAHIQASASKTGDIALRAGNQNRRTQAGQDD